MVFHTNPCKFRSGSRGRVQGVRNPFPPPPRDDLRFSYTTGILQLKKKNYLVYWCWSRARDECTPAPPHKKKSWIRPWNSTIFKLSLNLSLTHLRAEIARYELKGDLSTKMLKEIFHDFEVTRICMENHARVTGWQKLFFSFKASNFRLPLQSLLLRYRAEHSQVT